MFYDKEILSRDYKDKYNYAKTNLLNSCFSERLKKGIDDSPLFQSIINNGLITAKEICDNSDKSNPFYPFSVNPVYANTIDAIVRKTIDNEMIEKIIVNYLLNQYGESPEFITEKIECGKVDFKDEYDYYKNAEYDHFLFIRYCYCVIKYEITKQGTPLLDGEQYDESTRKMAYSDITVSTHENIDIKHPTLFAVISEFLDYDFDEKPKLIVRYVDKRIEELYDYILRKAGKKKTNCSNEVKNLTILATATGMTAVVNAAAKINNQNMLKKRLLDKDMFRAANKDDKVANVLNVSHLGVLNRIGINANTNIISRAIPSKFGDIELVNSYVNVCSLNFKNKNNENIVVNAILEDLLEKVADAYFSDDKEAVRAEQIVRTFEYKDEDCRVIFEKITSITYCLMMASINKGFITSEINDARYDNLSLYLPSGLQKAKRIESQKDFVKFNADKELKRLQDELDAANEKIESLRVEIDKLNQENQTLSEQNSKQNNKNNIITELKKQIGKLETENNQLQETNAKLNAQIHSDETNENKIEVIEAQNDGESTITQIDDEFFKDKKVIVVGGRTETNRRLADIMPKAKFIEKDSDQTQDVRQNEAVIMFTEFMSHLKFEKYISLCRLHNIPVLFLRKNNINMVKQEIYSFLNKIKN